MQMHSQFCQAASAIRRGSRHIQQDKPCQDAAFLLRKTDRYSGHPVSAMVLCDGAGSAAFSREGAQAASRATAELLTEHFSLMTDLGGQISAERAGWGPLAGGTETDLPAISAGKHVGRCRIG